MTPPTTLGPGSVLGRYELGPALGKGGMAQVFRATDNELGREVALKVLNFSISRQEDFRARFLREARVMAGLSHENIVKVYDCGEADTWAFIAMELIEGETLDARLQREPQPPLPWCVDVMRAVLGALDYVHAREIIHRDIKPHNVLLGKNDEIKLVDFGLVKAQDQLNVTRVGLRLGTPRYMSPEAALGETVTYQSDLFSAGLLFHELLTGRLPMEEIRDQASYDRLKTGVVPAPSRLRPGLPEEMDRILLKALAFKSWDRFDNAKKFSDAIGKVRLPTNEPPRASADPNAKKKRGDVTVVQAGPGTAGRDNTVIEQFDKVDAKKEERKHRDKDGKRKKHKHRTKRRRRWPLALGVLTGGVSALIVAVVLFAWDRSTPKPLPTASPSVSSSGRPTASPDQGKGGTSPLRASIVPGSPGPASDPRTELARARAVWAEISRPPGKIGTPSGLQLARDGFEHLDNALKGLGRQKLAAGLGPDGRVEFLHLLDRFDETITKVRDAESLFKGMLVEEAVLGRVFDIRQRIAGRNARLGMLDRLAPDEGSDPQFWELASRCAFRVGLMVPACIARYRWQEASAAVRRAASQPPVLPAELKLLGRADQVMLTIQLPKSAGVQPISSARAPWTPAWDRLAAALGGAKPAPPAVAPLVPQPSPSSSAKELGDELGDLDRMEDEILDKKPQAAPSAAVAKMAIRIRGHRMAAPALAAIETSVRELAATPVETSSKDGKMAKAIAAVVEQLGRLRACAKVDEAAIEFLEPGHRGLYEVLGELHAYIGRLPRVEGALRNALLEYVEALRQFGEIPIDDAAYWILYGQVAQAVGHVGVAEDAFLHALAAPLGHPEGRGPSDILTGPALDGLARAVWARFEITGDPGTHKPALLDHSLMDLDLFRLHLLEATVQLVPRTTLNAWSWTPATAQAVTGFAVKAREVLVRRGELSAK